MAVADRAAPRVRVGQGFFGQGIHPFAVHSPSEGPLGALDAGYRPWCPGTLDESTRLHKEAPMTVVATTVLPDALVIQKRQRIVDFAAVERIPVISERSVCAS